MEGSTKKTRISPLDTGVVAMLTLIFIIVTLVSTIVSATPVEKAIPLNERQLVIEEKASVVELQQENIVNNDMPKLIADHEKDYSALMSNNEQYSIVFIYADKDPVSNHV